MFYFPSSQHLLQSCLKRKTNKKSVAFCQFLLVFVTIPAASKKTINSFWQIHILLLIDLHSLIDTFIFWKIRIQLLPNPASSPDKLTLNFWRISVQIMTDQCPSNNKISCCKYSNKTIIFEKTNMQLLTNKHLAFEKLIISLLFIKHIIHI